MGNTDDCGLSEHCPLWNRHSLALKHRVPEKWQRLSLRTPQDRIDLVKLLSAVPLHPSRRVIVQHNGVTRGMQRVDVRVKGPMPKPERIEGLGKARRHPAGRGLGVLTELNEALGDIERVHDTLLFDTEGAGPSRLLG
jgi:hypothetical protein